MRKVLSLENAMRWAMIFLSLWAVLASGCMIIPAKVEKRRSQDEPIKYEKPALGFQPFGEDGGQFRFKYQHKERRFGFEFRKEFK